MKGYQLLLESEFLNQVMGLATAEDELKYAITHWLVDQVRKDDEISGLPIEIDVVKIHFHGSVYPCIGVHYVNQKPNLRFTDPDDTPDYGLLIEAQLEEIYKTHSFASFFDYVHKHQREIYQGLKEYKQKE
jgi:hypothetical protein